ncbi:MAG: thioredoxin family protein [Candidatus Eisenbacteria bacterium]|uniref:Thioredoxin family protein n=1 Tax=Eiseniibacteriota bacterium TaxID=2212470 RepID=A0A849SNN9_UNCEI|nr:thioredoxin family protein [Candidatus Eisenbacteria bacterium]
MAETLSTILPLGTTMPTYALTDAVSSEAFTDRTSAGAKGTLVMFICNHCPFVKHVMPELDRIAVDYLAQGIGIVAINANDLVAYPQDGPGPMRELAEARGWKFPFLFDQDQSVARAFGAACTPDFFAFDSQRRLAYRGRLDESRPGSTTPLTGIELRAALDAIVAGHDPTRDQQPSVGCNIKWTVPDAS